MKDLSWLIFMVILKNKRRVKKKMHLNDNHESDDLEAWNKSGFHFDQQVMFQGKQYMAVAIGYGILFDGKIKIERFGEAIVVDLKDVSPI